MGKASVSPALPLRSPERPDGGSPSAPTADGFEFDTNQLGHFALTGLLLGRILPVPGSRVVMLSSTEHRITAGIHFDDL